MAALESRLQRLEERMHVPGTRGRAEEIALQELIVHACYGVRSAADDIEASGRTWRGFDDFAHSAEVELIEHQRRLRELTGDDDAAWAERLQRIERGSYVEQRARLDRARGRNAPFST